MQTNITINYWSLTLYGPQNCLALLLWYPYWKSLSLSRATTLNIPFWCFSNCQHNLLPTHRRQLHFLFTMKTEPSEGSHTPSMSSIDIPAPTPSRCTMKSAAGPSSRIWSLHLGSKFYPLKSKDFFLKSLLGNISNLSLFQGSFSSTFEHVWGSQLKKKKFPLPHLTPALWFLTSHSHLNYLHSGFCPQQWPRYFSSSTLLVLSAMSETIPSHFRGLIYNLPPFKKWHTHTQTYIISTQGDRQKDRETERTEREGGRRGDKSLLIARPIIRLHLHIELLNLPVSSNTPQLSKSKS